MDSTAASQFGLFAVIWVPLPQAGAEPKPQETSGSAETAMRVEPEKERTPRLNGVGKGRGLYFT
jgi:hypothetical protein